jgi:hypothetical protein
MYPLTFNILHLYLTYEEEAKKKIGEDTAWQGSWGFNDKFIESKTGGISVTLS